MLRNLQEEVALWVKKNFDIGRPSYHPLLGVVEEVGELSHAILKRDQGIRTNENHDELIKDAVGDIVIYLADFCQAEGIDLESTVLEVWKEVKQRDWIENKVTGTKKQN